jgi:hypothetical protein
MIFLKKLWKSKSSTSKPITLNATQAPAVLDLGYEFSSTAILEKRGEIDGWARRTVEGLEAGITVVLAEYVNHLQNKIKTIEQDIKWWSIELELTKGISASYDQSIQFRLEDFKSAKSEFVSAINEVEAMPLVGQALAIKSAYQAGYKLAFVPGAVSSKGSDTHRFNPAKFKSDKEAV